MKNYNSPNNITWETTTIDRHISCRTSYSAVVFKNKIWFLGGVLEKQVGPNGSMRYITNDVYYYPK